VNLISAGKPTPDQAARPAQTIVRRFLVWAQAADAGERADAASALARAYRYSDFPAELRRKAVIGLTALVDDKSILVRRALAEALASAPDAPRHIVLALAFDQPDIAAIMVARSPMLNDADLVDCAAIGDDLVQVALARRPALGIGAAAALAEIGSREAVIALLENRQAPLTVGAMRRIAERFGDDGETREALLARPWLPAALRCDLVAATAEALSPLVAAFGVGEQRIERLVRDAYEEGAITIAGDTEGDDLAGLVRHLRASGGLTISLLMRGLVSGDRAFFETTAAELSGLPPARVAALARAPHGAGFAALYRRTGLPMRYFTPFRAALAALGEFAPSRKAGIVLPIAMRVIAACEAEGAPELDRLLSRLRRLESEAALEEARAFTADVVAEAASDEEVSHPVPQITVEPIPPVMAEPIPPVVAEPISAVMAEPIPAVMAEPVPSTVTAPVPLVAVEPVLTTPQPMPLLIELNGLDDIGVLRAPVETPPLEAAAKAA